MAIITASGKARTTEAIGENQTFRWLLRASSVSMLGSHVTAIAYPLLVLRLTSSPFTAGCVAFAATAPGILAHIPAGALVDRWNPRRAMLMSELGRGAAIAAVAITIAIGKTTVALLITTAFIEGILEVFSGLAERRYIGSLIRRPQAQSALARIEARMHLTLVAGRLFGGLLFELGSIVPFVADVLSFVYSVFVLGKIREIGDRFPVTNRRAHKSGNLINDMRQGLRQIKVDAFARMTILSFSIGTLAFQALIMIFLSDAHSRKLSAFAIGTVLAASGMGGAAGSALAPRLLTKLSRPWARIQILIWAAGFFLFTFPVGRNFIIAAIIMAALGFTGALGNIVLDTHLMQNSDKDMLARVTSVGLLATFTAFAVGTVLGGLGAQILGVQVAMVCLFLFTPVLVVLSMYTPLASNPHEESGIGPGEVWGEREAEDEPAPDASAWPREQQGHISLV